MNRKSTRLIALAAVAAVLLGLSSHIRVAYLATLVLVEATTPETDGPMATLRGDPIVEQVSFDVDGKTVVADLYRPAGEGRHPGIALNHGVAVRGKDDPRLVNFADALARAGYVALVPEFTGLSGFRIRTSDVDEVIASFEYLWNSPRVRPDRIGLFGFSYAGGLAVLAAADPRISDRVRFCFLLGAYCDLRSVVTYASTGMYREDGEWAYLEPRHTGKWAFLLNSVDLIGDEGDRELLEEIARAKLEDEDADVSDSVAALGEDARAAYAVMTNRDPERTDALIDALNERTRKYFDELSPRGRMEGLRARLILGHGRDDTSIPYTESVALAAEAPDEAPVHLAVLESFAHVDLKLGGGKGVKGWFGTIAEVGRLFSITYDLMAQGYL